MTASQLGDMLLGRVVTYFVAGMTAAVALGFGIAAVGMGSTQPLWGAVVVLPVMVLMVVVCKVYERED